METLEKIGTKTKIEQLEKEIASLKKQVRIHQEWIELCQKWMDTQVQLDKLLKS